MIDFKKELRSGFELFFSLNYGSEKVERYQNIKLENKYSFSNSEFELEDRIKVKKNKGNLPPYLLKDFIKNIESVYYFGSTTYGPKNKFGDIDVNICLESDYYENNQVILKAFKEIIDDFFTWVIGIETDINFSKKLSEPLNTFSQTLTKNYSRQIIKDYILSGVRMFQREEKVDTRNINGSLINSFEYNNCRHIPKEDVIQLNALSLLSKSRPVKLAKYSQTSLEYLIQLDYLGDKKFQWIEKDLSQDQIIMNAIKCYILNPKSYKENFFLFESQKEIEYEKSRVDQNLIKLMACMTQCEEIELKTKPDFNGTIHQEILKSPIVEGLNLKNLMKGYLNYEIVDNYSNQIGAISNLFKFDSQIREISPLNYIDHLLKFGSRQDILFLKSIAGIVKKNNKLDPFNKSYLPGHGFGEENIKKILQVSL